MLKMKKFLALVLAVLMTVSVLSACGDKPGADATGGSSANTEGNTQTTSGSVDNTTEGGQTEEITVGGDAVLVPQPVDADYYKDKKIVFIGDSITAGVGASANENRYVDQLASMLGLKYAINSGVSGNVMCRGSKRACNIDKLNETNCYNAAAVTILMGVNDYNCSIKDGEFMLQETDIVGDVHAMGEFLSDDATTIYGAMKMWCEQVVYLRGTKACKNTKFFFITPTPSLYNSSMHGGQNLDQNAVNSNGWKLRDLCEAMIKTCDYYKIPVLDLNRYSGMYHKNDSDTTIRYYLKDGVHPNDDGHKLIAEKLYQFLLMNPTYVPKESATSTDYIAPEFKDKLVANPVPEIHYDTSGIGGAIASTSGYRLPETLPTPTANGYTFKGWYLDEDLTVPANGNDVICSDAVLYAQWATN